MSETGYSEHEIPAESVGNALRRLGAGEPLSEAEQERWDAERPSEVDSPESVGAAEHERAQRAADGLLDCPAESDGEGARARRVDTVFDSRLSEHTAPDYTGNGERP